MAQTAGLAQTHLGGRGQYDATFGIQLAPDLDRTIAPKLAPRGDAVVGMIVSSLRVRRREGTNPSLPPLDGLASKIGVKEASALSGSMSS